MRIAAAAILLLSTASVAAGFVAEDRQALESYQLTEGNIEKVMRVNDRLTAEVRRDRSFIKQLRSSSRNDQTLTDSMGRLESIPTVKSALEQAGISARDFVLTNVAGMQASMVANVRQQYGNASEKIEGLNSANLQFVQTHPDLMKKWRDSSADTAREAQGEEKDPGDS